MRSQVREEVSFTAGRIIVRGRLHTRGKRRRADYVLSYKKNMPIAVIEAKDNNHSLGDGMQQALAYSDALDAPFVFSSNGDGFLFHDRTGLYGKTESTLSLDEFPPLTRSGTSTASTRALPWLAVKLSSSRTTMTAVAEHLATIKQWPLIAL